MADPAGVTDDLFLGGRLRLRQPRRGHRAGHDAVLLAAATAARPPSSAATRSSSAATVGLLRRE